MINVYVLLLLVFFIITELNAECVFSLNDHVPQNIILMRKYQNKEMIYPSKSNEIKMSTEFSFVVSCGDKYFNTKLKKLNKLKKVIASCDSKDKIKVGNEQIRLRELKCQDFPTSKLRKKENKKCYNYNSLFDIGFEFGKYFLEIIRVCFDEEKRESRYSWYDFSMLSTGHQSKVKRPRFLGGDLYRFPVDEVYTIRHQQDWFTKLLKDRKKALEYIKKDNKHFLAKGHLTPKADMVYGSEQSATFHYINAAPQWQCFNNGHWYQVEESVRKKLLRKKDDKRYRVVTGTYGVATLPDVNNIEQELYLYEDKNKNPLLKVPKLFWKIVYDMKHQTGVVILGVNNPYLDPENIPPDYIICREICNKIDWLPKFNKDICKGYIYCCEMEEFLKATGYDKSFMD